MLGSGCHAKSKCLELSYKLGYLITAALFFPVRPIRPVCTYIIRIFWISTFHGHRPHFLDISVFVGSICILWISWIYPHFIDLFVLVTLQAT